MQQETHAVPNVTSGIAALQTREEFSSRSGKDGKEPVAAAGRDGGLEHFPVVGYVVVRATLTAMFTTWKMKPRIERGAATARLAAT